MIESLLLTATQISTFNGQTLLTNASGFLFERDERLFLVTSRHVLVDQPSGHRPDRIEIRLHTDAGDLTKVFILSMLLYSGGNGVWRQGRDSGGEIDVAAIEIDRSVLPAALVLYAFTPNHLQASLTDVEVGSAVLIVGFPLGFHDTVFHLPVVRRGSIASSFGVRFQGQGYFLTDARTHRGTSGSPVVLHAAPSDRGVGTLPWKLLGVHSSRVDMNTRDQDVDESLGLNCAWYADILLALTA